MSTKDLIEEQARDIRRFTIVLLIIGLAVLVPSTILYDVMCDDQVKSLISALGGLLFCLWALSNLWLAKMFEVIKAIHYPDEE